jgi:hypothetical protein
MIPYFIGFSSGASHAPVSENCVRQRTNGLYSADVRQATAEFFFLDKAEPNLLQILSISVERMLDPIS